MSTITVTVHERKADSSAPFPGEPEVATNSVCGGSWRGVGDATVRDPEFTGPDLIAALSPLSA